MTLNVRNKRFPYAYRAKRCVRYILKQFYQRVSWTNESRAVFILGSGRSGTDIVAHCLSKAWDVELINEDNPKAFDNWRLKCLDAVSEAVKASGAKLVLFKPIVETLRAREFLDHFSGSSVVFVIRNPYDAINSMVRFFGDGHVRAVQSWVASDFSRQSQAPDSVKQFVKSQCHESLSIEDASGLYWLVYNSAFDFLDLSSCASATMVRYESLVQQPDQTMEQVCRFLDLKWNPSMTDEVYSGSLGKNPKPDLSPEIERACLAQWERLTGEKLSSSI